MSSDDKLIGVLLRNGYLKTDYGEIFLTKIQIQAGVSPESGALDIPMQDIGKIAIVSGNLSELILYSAKIVKTMSILSSGLVTALLKKELITLNEIRKEVIEVEDAEKEKKVTKKLCALVIGHKKNSPGAVNRRTNLSEFDFNNDLANRIETKVRKASIVKVFREKTYRELPQVINTLDPDFVVSLHCNAFNGTATGTEVLYYHKSKMGEEMAHILSKHFINYLGLPDRGIKSRTVEDRGGHLLRYTHAPCVIVEPFFIDNDKDLAIAQKDKDGLAAVYANAIDEITQTAFSTFFISPGVSPQSS